MKVAVHNGCLKTRNDIGPDLNLQTKRFIANLLYFNKGEINVVPFRLVFPNLCAGDLTYCLPLNSKRGDLLLCVGDVNLERDAFMRT